MISSYGLAVVVNIFRSKKLPVPRKEGMECWSLVERTEEIVRVAVWLLNSATAHHPGCAQGLDHAC